MKRSYLLVAAVSLLFVSTAVNAQNTITAATPAEQAKIKPLIEAETKARESLNAKITTLPEAKAYNEAQADLKLATAAFDKWLETSTAPEAKALRDVRTKAQKSLEDLNKAAETLPENTAWKQASIKVLDEAYRIQATHSLSSREFRPQLNAKGELEFARLEQPKP